MSNLRVYRPKKILIAREVALVAFVGIFVALPIMIFIDHMFKLNSNLSSIVGIIIGVCLGTGKASQTYKTDRSIIISDKGISGKMFMGRNRIAISFNEISIDKSKKRTFFEYIAGLHNIVDKNGLRLEFFRRIFSKEDVSFILSKCQIEPNKK